MYQAIFVFTDEFHFIEFDIGLLIELNYHQLISNDLTVI